MRLANHIAKSLYSTALSIDIVNVINDIDAQCSNDKFDNMSLIVILKHAKQSTLLTSPFANIYYLINQLPLLP